MRYVMREEEEEEEEEKADEDEWNDCDPVRRRC